MSVRSPGGSIYDLWLSTAEAQLNTWTTLAIRLPMMMAGTLTQPEGARMVTEKLEAASESARDAGLALGRLMVRQPSSLLNPHTGLSTLVAVMQAASDPYHRRVRANAKRLQKG